MLLRRLPVAIVLALVGSLTASVWASCIVDVGMNMSAQMACCENGRDKCPMHGTAEDCCKSEGQRQQQVSVATHEAPRSGVNAPAVLATPVPMSFGATVIRASRASFDRDVLKGPDAPRYLLGSAFLV